MIGLNLGIVVSQVPEKHGVQVMWRNLDYQAVPDPAGQGCGFARVGARRAHPTLGSETDLPAVNELGLVATIDEELSVWICSLHWQQDNAIIPGLTLKRHDSGVTSQINANGECQVDFPGGARIRCTLEDAPLTIPEAQPNISSLGAKEVHWMCLDHPCGLSIKISPLGDLEILGANSITMSAVAPINITGYGTFNLATLPMDSNPNAANDWGPDYASNPQAAIDININSGGAINLNATGTVNLQGGGNQFCMKPLWDWVKTHTHPSNGAQPSNPPADGTVLSPTTLAGPTAS
jgi:hypothetical protein